MTTIQKTGYLLMLGIFGSIWVVWTGFKSAPVILSDEWTYRKQIAFQSPLEYSIPNFLYSWVYGLSNLFENFYLVTQILNLAFFLAFCFVVYLSARLFTGFWPSALLSLGVLISPLGLFVGLQMPDSPYYFLVSLSLYFLLRALFFAETTKNFLNLVGLSCLVFLVASFVKPHAFFFLFTCLVLAVIFRPQNLVSFRRSLVYSLGLGSTWLISKLGIGFLVGGQKGFALFGEGYERALFERLFGLNLPTQNLAMAASIAAETQQRLNWLPLIANFVIWFALLFGTFWIIRNQIDPEYREPVFFMISVIAGISGIIFAFQIFVTLNGDIHTDRLLLRHFEFVIPLLVATLLARENFYNRISKKNAFYLFSILAAMVFLPIPPYSPNLSDSSLLYGFTGNRVVLIVLIGFAVLVWFYAKSIVWFTASIAAISFLGSILSQPQLAYRNEVSQIEKSVEVFVGLRDDESVPVMVSYRNQDAASFLFLLNRGLGAYSVVDSPATILDLGTIDRNKDILIIGNVEVLGGEEFVTLEPGYSRLYPALGSRLEGQRLYPEALQISSIDPAPTQNGFGPIIRANSILLLASPLNPGDRLKLSLLGHSEDHGGETLILGLGGERISLAIPQFSELQEFYLEFPNSRPSDKLEFDLSGLDFEFTIAEISKVRD